MSEQLEQKAASILDEGGVQAATEFPIGTNGTTSWIDTGDFSPEQGVLLALAEQLSSEADLRFDLNAGNIDSLKAVAINLGLKLGDDTTDESFLTLLAGAMSLCSLIHANSEDEIM